MGSRLTWREICRSEGYRGRWVALDNCRYDRSTASPSEGDVAQNESALSTTTGTTFQFTYYWVSQRPSGDANQVTLRDCSGKFLTYASYSWRDKVRAHRQRLSARQKL